MKNRSCSLTPWQKVFAKFGMSQSELARHLGCHRSKINRAVRDREGIINGRDQVKLLNAAVKLNVNLSPDDIVPKPDALA